MEGVQEGLWDGTQKIDPKNMYTLKHLEYQHPDRGRQQRSYERERKKWNL